MTTKRITVALLIAVAALLIGWDIYVAVNDVKGDTISELTLGFYRRHEGIKTLFSLAIGFVLGHLFWPQKIKDTSD